MATATRLLALRASRLARQIRRPMSQTLRSSSILAATPNRPGLRMPCLTAVPHRTLFIQTKDTPNPNSLMFYPGVEVSHTTHRPCCCLRC
eukprot:m.192812 g.192812  ORF g.192812 m.192812 type:complete len:90 (+) comp16969_c0_seq5:3419-3688(+)